MKSDFEFIPDHVFNETDYTPFSVSAFEKYLHDEITVVRRQNCIEVTVPFVCSSKDQNTITFVVKPVDEEVVEICDNGACLHLLEQRVGDLDKYKKWLSDFESKTQRIKFVSGRNMTLTVWGVRGRYDVLSGFFDMFSYASIVANADMYPLTKEQAQGGAK